MARERKSTGRGGRQRPIKGFRPGKEPPQLRKQRAKTQLGEDATWAQKKLVDSLADRSPEQARAMMRRWRGYALAAAVVLAVLGVLLYLRSVVAGAVVHVLAAAVFVVWFRLRRQQAHFDTLVDMVSGRGGGRR